ncbi:MAG TPA: SdrD B-like domain-containing protein [Longimicrobiales bacterium]|nr:SdrD B-like domain-containing protein [Longimicrobiales bacterium]
MAAVALALALGCSDDSTAPAGTASTLAVRAYVDADGSGSFSTGDVSIAGQTVSLESSSGAGIAQATTDAQGVATFQNVAPGTYTVRFGGSAPAGAVLASATQPVVVAPFRGGDVTSEFRFVFNPGQITGVVYRDNNGNTTFDPGIDTPAPGITVQLFRGTDTTTVVATTTTSATGAFNFDVLRPGSYTVRVLPLPTMQIVGGNTATFTVAAAAPTAAAFRFTGQLLLPITEVRQQPTGTTVAFEGVATVSVGVFSTSTTSNQFNVQSGANGILVLQVPLSSGIQQGDSVRVIGTTAISVGEFLITGNPVVTRLASGRTVPAPVTITAARVAASSPTEPLQGSLVKVERVRVDSLGNGTTAYNVFVTGEDGSRFIVRVSSGVARDTWTVGNAYNVTGTLGAFNAPQVKVRGAADVTAASLSTPIAQARLLPTGTVVTVEGVATVSVGVFSTSVTSNQFNVQDATGGILVLQVPLASGVQQGDSVRVTGTVTISVGELLLTTNPTVTILGSGRVVPAPRLVTAAQVAASTATYPVQGSLVHVRAVRADSLGTGTTAYNVFVTGSDGSRFIVRVSSGVARSVWEIGSTYNITGTLGAFNAPQVKVRGSGDVAPAASPVPIGVARQLPAATVVTVEGIATVSVGVFSTNTTSNQFNVQDATGGILVLQVPLASGIQQGDSVRVTGTTAVSVGEFLLTTSPQVTVLASARPLPAPLLLSAAQVAASSATYPDQGRLVRVQNVRVDSIGAGTTAYNVFVTGEGGARFIVRVSSGVPRDTWIVNRFYTVTGTLGAFNAPQVKVRGATDVQLIDASGSTAALDLAERRARRAGPTHPHALTDGQAGRTSNFSDNFRMEAKET